jgi:dCMP deaminase
VLLAEAAAARSEDPFLKVGCSLIRHDRTVASVGYNGAPPGINIDWDDRDERRKKVVHAEANALRYVTPQEVLFAATTYMPCLECVRAFAAYGVKYVIYKNELPQEYHDREAIMALSSEFQIIIVQVEE